MKDKTAFKNHQNYIQLYARSNPEKRASLSLISAMGQLAFNDKELVDHH